MSTRIPIQCSGETHYITVTDDYKVEIDTEKHDTELELALGALGGEMSRCVQLLRSKDDRGGLAKNMPGLSSEQRFMLAMAGNSSFWCGQVALHTKNLDPARRYKLAMRSGRPGSWFRREIAKHSDFGFSEKQRLQLDPHFDPKLAPSLTREDAN